MEFNGIQPEAVCLLAENRFQNSKIFYEAHKKEIQEGVVLPLRRLASDLRPVLEAINPAFLLDPQRCLSRVRRDTRFTNDKSLYRENLWLMFRHQKNDLPTPMFWFELFPDGYCYGCGILSTTPAFLEDWRRTLKADAAPLLAAAKEAFEAGTVFDGERYKRSKAATDGITDPDAALWYDAKALFVSRRVNGIRRLSQPRALLRELTGAYEAMSGLYRYMLAQTQRYNAGRESDEDR